MGGAQTAISGIANSQTTYTSGTVSLSELGAITIRSTTGNQFQFSVNSQTAQTGISGIANSQTTYTSGTVSLSELGAITIRSTTGNQYQLSVNAQTTQTQGILSAGVSNVGNTAGQTTVNTGSRMVLAGAGEITLSQATAAGASTISISAPAQTVQTQGVLSVGASNLGNTAGNTTVNTGSRLVLVGTNMISLSQTTGAGATTLSINATQSAQTQSNIQALYDGANSISTGTIRVTNANGVSFSVNAQTLSASVNESISMFAVSNTTQSTSGTAHKSALSFGGAGVASVGVTGGSVVVSAPVGGGVFSGGMSTHGNTAGDTGYASQRLNLVGSNNITISGSTDGGSMTLSLFGPTPGAAQFSVGVSTGGNTAGNTGVSGTLSACGLGAQTGSGMPRISINASRPRPRSRPPGWSRSRRNGSTISIGVPGTLADWQNFPQGQAALNDAHRVHLQDSLLLARDHAGRITNANSLAFKVSFVTANTLASMSAHLGIYTMVNSTSMALLGSLSEA